MKMYNIYFRLILLFPLTTVIQGKVEFINRVLFVAFFLTQIVILGKKNSEKWFLFLFMAFGTYIITLLKTNELTIDNNVFYFFNFLIFSTVITLNVRKLDIFIKTNEKFIFYILNIWTIIVFISIFFPSSYYIKEAGMKYFGSFSGSIFRLGPSALFIATLALLSIVIYNRKINFVYLILPLYCGLQGSSRTYLFLITAIVLLYIYFTSKTTLSFYLKIIPGLALFIILIYNSGIFNKIAFTLDSSQYGDLMFRLSSSRSVIWDKLLNAYTDLSLSNKIFGNGFYFTNKVADHYAHNDFLEILLIHGLISIGLYLFAIYSMIHSFTKNQKVKFGILLIVINIWFLNANFNMFYNYICAAFSFPFLLYTVSFAKKNISYYGTEAKN